MSRKPSYSQYMLHECRLSFSNRLIWSLAFLACYLGSPCMLSWLSLRVILASQSALFLNSNNPLQVYHVGFLWWSLLTCVIHCHTSRYHSTARSLIVTDINWRFEELYTGFLLLNDINKRFKGRYSGSLLLKDINERFGGLYESFIKLQNWKTETEQETQQT